MNLRDLTEIYIALHNAFWRLVVDEIEGLWE